MSLHYVGSQGHVPLALRLFLPESWLEAPARLDKAGVPASERRALQRRDHPGVARRRARRARAAWPGGRGRQRPRSQRTFARGLGHPRLALRAGRDWGDGRLYRATSLAGAGSALGWTTRRHGWTTGECAGEEAIWLLIEEPPDGTIKYAFSNLPAGTSRLRAVRLWRERWKIEQGYQQRKEELGLDHFEGRSWRGFHHHAVLVMLAFGFLALEQRRVKQRPASKKSLLPRQS